MCLAQGPHYSDAGEARTRGPSVLSQALSHCAPADFFVKQPLQNFPSGIPVKCHSLDLDQVQHLVEPDLGLNGLQSLTVDIKLPLARK